MREEHIHRPSERYPGDLRRGARFVDAHVHLKDTCCLDTIVDAGVGAVRDAGRRGNITDGINSIARDNSLPRIISARWALYKKGGYGSLFGIPVTTREEIKSAIHTLKDAGAGIIKIMASGMVSLKEPGRVTAGGFDKDELRFIVQSAATCGMGVMAHANGEHAIIDAAEAGVRSIEHGFFMSRRALDSMAKKSTFWVPTVGALKRAAESAQVSKETEDFVAGLIGSHLEMMRYAQGIGVPLAVGTDCVLPDPRYAEVYEAELLYFQQAGIPYGEVMKIACERGASLLGL
ncbi:MAG: amidohydrolase family protein [Nitrospirae bacterium]|nr:amidohydrolase family protein [Nitrospirota bacterium]